MRLSLASLTCPFTCSFTCSLKVRLSLVDLAAPLVPLAAGTLGTPAGLRPVLARLAAVLLANPAAPAGAGGSARPAASSSSSSAAGRDDDDLRAAAAQAQAAITRCVDGAFFVAQVFFIGCFFCAWAGAGEGVRSGACPGPRWLGRSRVCFACAMVRYV